MQNLITNFLEHQSSNKYLLNNRCENLAQFTQKHPISNSTTNECSRETIKKIPEDAATEACTIHSNRPNLPTASDTKAVERNDCFSKILQNPKGWEKKNKTEKTPFK